MTSSRWRSYKVEVHVSLGAIKNVVRPYLLV